MITDDAGRFTGRVAFINGAGSGIGRAPAGRTWVIACARPVSEELLWPCRCQQSRVVPAVRQISWARSGANAPIL